MRWWFVALVLVLACSCTFRKVEQAPSDGTTSDDGPTRDGPPMDARQPDAPPAVVCDPAACAAVPNGNGTCDPVTNHCRLQTIGANGFTCPPGHFCDITCGGTQGCRNGVVNCTSAVGCVVTCGAGGSGDIACDMGVRCPATGPCTVTCNGGSTCRNAAVTCGAGPCNVQCLGTDACGNHGVDCKASAKCDVRCEGANACKVGGVACGPGTCNVTCEGDNACQGLPGTCTVTPTQCAFHCCGANTCQTGVLCSTCSRDAICP